MNERERVLASYTWLTVAEFASAIRRSDDFVRGLLHAPDATGFQIRDAIQAGSGYLIKPGELDRYVESHKIA